MQMTRTTRREEPLWETLERFVNEVLRSISISGRDGRVPVALDDDKIWMDISNARSSDLFNLKFTTHVKPNRKGIVAHTAVSTCLNIPLGIVFEKPKTLHFNASKDASIFYSVQMEKRISEM